ncbi:POK18 protein, partial [Neopipo cinnamomea]|nr:POK18 protein [Neopipo cinnamomea]
DKEKFAFTVPSINHAEPSKLYHWNVLPQGMKNSPTICQWFVAQALSPVRDKHPEGYCYHYMDDFLLAAPSSNMLSAMESDTHASLKEYGLVVAPEKVQRVWPWSYLGMKVLERTVQPQALQLNVSIKNLNDIQKLASTINWLRPYLGLTTLQIQPLFDLLKGDLDLRAPRNLTPKAKQVITLVEQQIQTKHVWRIDNMVPFAMIAQWNPNWVDHLHVLEWLFLSVRSKETAPGLFKLLAQLIIKARSRCTELMVHDPEAIVVPVQLDYFEWCLANSSALQAALTNIKGAISYHLPSHPLCKLHDLLSLGQKLLSSSIPVSGPTVFTDGS